MAYEVILDMSIDHSEKSKKLPLLLYERVQLCLSDEGEWFYLGYESMFDQTIEADVYRNVPASHVLQLFDQLENSQGVERFFPECKSSA